MSNIVLIGMPGCGKSTCGVLAAKLLCMAFCDTDLVIQAENGMKLQELINRFGPAYFAKAEERAITSLALRNTVIATGGSVVYSQAAMQALKRDGLVVYLRISYEHMLRRIQNPATRGILLKEGATLQSMYEERIALYEQYADVTVDCTDDDVEATVQTMLSAIARYQMALSHPLDPLE